VFRNVLLRLTIVFTLVFSVGLVGVSPATAADSLLPGQSAVYYKACGDFRPSSGSFSPVRKGSQFTVTWSFRLNAAVKRALDCVANKFGQNYLELEIYLTGFAGEKEWDYYNILATNLPGAVHDVAFNDPAEEATPAVTGIRTASLKADTSYYFSIRWNTSEDFYPVSGQAQRGDFRWIPSHWASIFNPFEATSCLTHGGAGWCVFPGALAYISGAYYTFFATRDGLPFNSGPTVYPFPRTTNGGSQTGGNSSGSSGSSSNPKQPTTKDTDSDGLSDTADACPTVAGLATLRGCPPSKARDDLAWYDNRTLWGFAGPGMANKAEMPFGRPDWAGAGDYDHDGIEDLYWYHESSTTIYVILGGDFTRVVVARGPGVGKPTWAGVGDFDGNGFRDEIAWYDGRMLFLLRGTGLGTVYETDNFSPPTWAGVADDTKDGKDDLYWYHGGTNGTIYGIPSTGSGFGGAYWVRGPGIGEPQWAGVGDFDGDGFRNDLAWFAGGWLFTFTGSGLGTTGERYGYAMPDWAGVGHCDASGRDSLFWYHGPPNGTVYCIQNNGRQFTDAFAVRGPGIGPPVWAGTGDFYN